MQSFPKMYTSIFDLQENLLKTMMTIENVFFDLAESTVKNCLVICDRGAMDASAFISKKQWDSILARNSLDEVEIRDKRYDQVCTLLNTVWKKKIITYFNCSTEISICKSLRSAEFLEAISLNWTKLIKQILKYIHKCMLAIFSSFLGHSYGICRKRRGTILHN